MKAPAARWGAAGVSLAWGLAGLGSAWGLLACSTDRVFTLGKSAPEGALAFEFAQPTLIEELNSDGKEDNPTLTRDLLELCFTSEREGGTGDVDIWCATRQERGEPFGEPQEQSAIDTDGFESSAALALDGLTLWWGSEREGGQGGLDIWHATREGRDQPFEEAQIVPALNSDQDDIPRPLGGPGDAIMPLGSRRQGGKYWTYFAEKQGSAADFLEPLAVVRWAETPGSMVDAFLSEDGLLLLFTYIDADVDPGELYFARRSNIDEDFAPPAPIAGVNSEDDDRDAWLSPDGQELFFSSNREGNFNLYRATLR